MKRFIPFLLVFVLLPQIALAAWWNPFTWKIFNRENSKTQILENRVKDLEEKLGESSEVVATSTVILQKEEVKKDTPPVSNSDIYSPKPSSKSTTENVVNPGRSVNINSETFSDIYKKYSDLRTSTYNEKGMLDKSSNLLSEKIYYKYIDQLLTKVNADLGYLGQIEYVNPKPNGIVEIYVSKYNQLYNEHKTERDRYEKESQVEGHLKEMTPSEEARKNSPECVDATQLLKSLDKEISPLKEVNDKRYDEYLRTGKYITPALSRTNSDALADLDFRRSGVQTKYYAACMGYVPVPSKIYNTNCYSLAGSVSCYTQ